MKQFLKKYAFVFGLIVIIVPVLVLAGPNDNVSGYAWSDMPNDSDQEITPDNHYGGRGLGWIKLNGDLYGVNLNESTGAFDGYAWSEYGGWVDFSPSGPYPAGPNHGAQVDPNCLANRAESCPVTGWIRFTAGGSDQSGGWDGWVKMSGSNYGVTLAAADANGVRPMSGKAWGDMVAGWIDFRAEVKMTVLSQPVEICNDPDATNYLPLENRDPNKIYVPDPALCEYDPSIPGCTDPSASNYNPSATVSDGSCTYDVCKNIPGDQPAPPDGWEEGENGICISTLPQCQPPRVGTPPRCVCPIAGQVYNSVNNTCTTPGVPGCTIAGYDNYNPNATVNDGSCSCDNPKEIWVAGTCVIPTGGPKVPIFEEV